MRSPRQNITCKQLFKSEKNQSTTFKLDKLNLLFYPSSIAFISMFPFWLFSDGQTLFTLQASLPSTRLVILFLLNGLSHFAQNVLAFTLLAKVSPITYSIASLFKRIFVISASIVYFKDQVNIYQGLGISLTFVGLWLYNTARKDVATKEEMVEKIQERRNSDALPLTMDYKSTF